MHLKVFFNNTRHFFQPIMAFKSKFQYIVPYEDFLNNSNSILKVILSRQNFSEAKTLVAVFPNVLENAFYRHRRILRKSLRNNPICGSCFFSPIILEYFFDYGKLLSRHYQIEKNFPSNYDSFLLIFLYIFINQPYNF